MAPQPASREGSFTQETRLSRRASAQSALSNVFSDDHAYSDGDLTPVNSVQHSSLDFPRGPPDNNAPHVTTNVPRSAAPLSFTSAERPLSASKRTISPGSTPLPHRAITAVADSDAGSQRTFSTSSRFSMPRSQSPYNGPSAPSQPYAMYPQVTRASSIASESTIRPPERPFVAQGGPEHPYGMYQNTVPEEDDDGDDGNSPHIPLGFPALANSFRAGSSSSGNDTGDIVGSDGHIEQLPPYSRYADNVIAKGDMGTIDPPATSLVESTSAQSDPASSDSALELNRPRAEQMEEEEEVAKKEGWFAKSKKRKCCGMPLLAMMAICFTIFAAAAMGGIIGGVIGNEKGADRAFASSAATTTVWLDADPVATGPATPPCPTGHFTIPLNNTEQIGTCVVDQNNLGPTWDCMNEAYLGISLWDHGPGRPYQIAFDDYSVRPQLFEYGPQPPDFNGTAFELQPVKDKDDSNLGVAMFFSHLFDKLIILEAGALMPPPGNKRSVDAQQIRRRASSPPPNPYLAVADQPWFCFWNSTIEEFWIFLQEDIYPNSSSSTTAMQPSSPASSVTSAPSGLSLTPTPSTYGKGYAPPPATTQTYPGSPGATPTNSWAGPKAKRSSPYSDPDVQNAFPKLIKMVEKRKPHGNIQPYCQQMQVLNDWQIVPIPTIPIIYIEENEFAKPTGSNKRWMPRKRGNPTVELESDCICEWYSIPFQDSD